LRKITRRKTSLSCRCVDSQGLEWLQLGERGWFLADAEGIQAVVNDGLLFAVMVVQGRYGRKD